MAKVLLVDDNELFRKTLRLILQKGGHQVVEAENGQNVSPLLETGHFDILLLDIIMPGKGGIETLADLSPSDDSYKVIVMTGRIDTNSQAFQDLCRRFRAEAILAKPFTARQLLETIDKLLGSGAV